MSETSEIKTLPWVEHLTVRSNLNVNKEIIDIEDELKREMTFYTASLSAANQAYQHALDINLPFWRPKNYFAQMAKDDHHMHKVENKLIADAVKIQNVEQRKMQKQYKQYAKGIQDMKKQEKSAKKKSQMEMYTRLRQQGNNRDDSTTSRKIGYKSFEDVEKAAKKLSNKPQSKGSFRQNPPKKRKRTFKKRR